MARITVRPVNTAFESRYQAFLDAYRGGHDITIEADEHLFLRIRVGVLRGEIRQEDVDILFTRNDEFGADVTRVNVDRHGNVDEWPRGMHDAYETMLFEMLDGPREVMENRS